VVVPCVSGSFYGYISRNEVYLVDHKPNLFEVEKAEKVLKCAYAEKDPVSAIALASLSAGRVLLVASTAGTLHVFDETGERTLHSHKLQKSQVALSAKDAYLRGVTHDGKESLFLGSGSGDVLLFTLTAAKLALTKKVATSFSRAIWAVHYSAAHSLLMAGDDAGNLSVFNAPAGTDSPTKAFEVKGSGCPITSLACGHGLIVSADVTGRIRAYSIEKKSLAVEICAHARPINAIDLHPTLPIVVAVSEDTHLSVWTLPTPSQPVVKNILMFAPAPALLTGVKFSGKNAEHIVATIYDSKSLFSIPTPAL
jgi:WD40 repeat protein